MQKAEVIVFPKNNIINNAKIKLLIVGYGKMGKVICENADYINGKIVAIYDPYIPEYSSLNVIDFENIDVAIEFTNPDSGYENVKMLLSRRIPVVTGTTGWFDKIPELAKLFKPDENTLIYGSNFSVGMNLFYKMVAESTKLITKTELYDVYGHESHHRYKADSPSGTARVLADIILENNAEKENVIFDLNNNSLKENEFSFSSTRAGNIIGYHEVGFDSDFDEIKLIHNAKSRKGFALGALLAAKYAKAKKGYMNFKDIFNEILSAT